jgi:hypothetical protein
MFNRDTIVQYAFKDNNFSTNKIGEISIHFEKGNTLVDFSKRQALFLKGGDKVPSKKQIE